MKVQNVGYIRVSSSDQNPERQLENVKLDKKFIDMYTGSIKDRPQLNECLTYLREGDTLHVHSIDRLARNLINLQTIVDDLVGRGVTVIFHNENLKFDNSHNPMARFTLQFMGAFAEFERAKSRERQKEGIDLARREGRSLGRPRLNLKLASEAARLRAEGMSVRKIGRHLDLSPPSVYKLLEHYKKTNKDICME